MGSPSLVNGRQIVEHPIRSVDFIFKIAQNVGYAFDGAPDRRDIVAGRLLHENGFVKAIPEFLDDGH